MLGPPGVAVRVAGAGLADVFLDVHQQVGDANEAKQRGLYADLLADGVLRVPSEVSQNEACAAVTRAREVGASAVLLHDPGALAVFADPPAEALEMAAGLFGTWLGMKSANVDAAAAVMAGMAAEVAAAE